MQTRPTILLDPFPRNEAMVYTPDAAAALAEMGDVVSHFGSRAPDDLVEEVLPRVNIIIGQTAMPRERLERAPGLRAILNVKANWEPNIDYSHAHARGIHVLSAAPAMAPAVAEFCIAQAITLARGLGRADGLFRAGNESYGIAGNGDVYSLLGASVGLVGFGNLGKSLLPLLQPFTSNINVYDPWLSDHYLASQQMQPRSIDTLLSESQFIFLLAGVTEDNEGFLDRQMLRQIRTDASVVLASRAEIVEFDTFVELAQEGQFRAAIDVYPEEPVASDATFRNAPNILFSSHLAGGLNDSYQRIRDMMLDDTRQILKGLPPLSMQRAEPSLAAQMRSR